MNISFIGFGNMAKAIARGLGNYPELYSLSASAPSLADGINKNKIRTHSDNKELIKNADLIILAVKPAQMKVVLQEITPQLSKNSLLISIAAGLNFSWFSHYCPKEQAIIRTMPNTPAAVGLAATPMIANQFTTAEQKQWAEQIFTTIGIVTWAATEADMDSFTALSGSGPAYVFLFIEAMVDAAVAMGIEPTIAKKFALQTFRGAIKLAENDDLSLNLLRTKVTSPGGTTAAALEVLNGRFDALIIAAMEAAKCRSQDISAAY
ncbi:MAG: pyrroline-5-carboxylate reductase [Legionella sp.]|nr:pyrroline-5-carboxylate reductase [Legionella sp.]